MMIDNNEFTKKDIANFLSKIGDDDVDYLLSEYEGLEGIQEYLNTFLINFYDALPEIMESLISKVEDCDTHILDRLKEKGFIK